MLLTIQWPAPHNLLVGIADPEERVGALISQGSAAERAWLGRALLAMGPRGAEIAKEAQRNRTSSSSRLAWIESVAAAMAPFCEPCGPALTVRRDPLEPAVFGGPSGVSPLSALAEAIARIQIASGVTPPFVAYDLGGDLVDWPAVPPPSAT